MLRKFNVGKPKKGRCYVGQLVEPRWDEPKLYIALGPNSFEEILKRTIKNIYEDDPAAKAEFMEQFVDTVVV